MMLPRSAISLLEPKCILPGSILLLTPDLIQQQGLKGLVLDVDDTLISTRSATIPRAVRIWVTEVRQVTSLSLVSNNLSHKRIARIARILDLPYIFGARKPSRRRVRQAVDQMQLTLPEVGMVGDRLFTDVLVGNRLGMFTILVEPMADGNSPQSRKSCLRTVEIRLSRLLGANVKNDFKT